MLKELKKIVLGINVIRSQGDLSVRLEGICSDSRKANLGQAFVALVGTLVDGHDFIPQVLEQGCQVIVVEKWVDLPEHITQIQIEDTHAALGIMASNFFDNPSEQLKLVGVTGTNGKTTVATLLFNLFRKLGYPTGLLSTVENRINDVVIPSTHTTPDPIALNELLAQMVSEGCSHCFMEVSSHAIAQHRIAGLQFDGAIFTNISHDHLDYHKTFAAYIKAKKQFFDGLSKSAFALVNADDKNGDVMVQNCMGRKLTFGLRNMADYKAKVLENQFSGLVLQLDGVEFWSRLIGDFNAYNLLAVYATAIELDEDKQEVLTALSELESVNGRFQYVNSAGGIMAIVDYAHTPDALENVLETIQNIRTKNETVFTVVGCGGDRDKTKRPEMAKIACQLSDKVILTSDNPRSEDPQEILNDMMEGVEGHVYHKTLCIVDRKEAIKTAVAMAQPKDIILIAGKGHETYQEIKGVKHDFDDKKITVELFQKMNK